MADANGTIQERYFYDAYGTPSFTDGSGTVSRLQSQFGISHLFTGQRWDANLGDPNDPVTPGLYDLRNRYYHPVLGRFLQPDPIGFAGDRINIYRYCGNNPANKTDPSGLGNKLDGVSDGTQKFTPLGSNIPIPAGESVYNAFNLPSGYSSTNGWGSVSGTPSAGGRAPSGSEAGNNDGSLSMGWLDANGRQTDKEPPAVEIERIYVVGAEVNPLWAYTLGDIFGYGSNSQLGQLAHYNNEHREDVNRRVKFADAVDHTVGYGAAAAVALPVFVPLAADAFYATAAHPLAIVNVSSIVSGALGLGIDNNIGYQVGLPVIQSRIQYAAETIGELLPSPYPGQ